MPGAYLLCLPEDLLCHMFSYCNFIDIMTCHSLCVDLRDYLQNHPILYRRLIRQTYFPNYEPFQICSLTPLEEKKVLRKWFKKEYKWTKIGSLNESYGRYLHRAVPFSHPNGVHGAILYGGVTRQGYCTCDLWSLSLSQQTLSFQQIQYQDQSHFHHLHAAAAVDLDINLNPITPPNNSAYSMSGDNFGNLYLFGGRVHEWRHDQLESSFTNGLWQYHRPTNQWTNLHSSFLITQERISPPATWGHTTVIYEDILFLFGGSSTGMTFNDLWMIDLRHIRSEMQRRQSEVTDSDTITAVGRGLGGLAARPSAFISDHWKLISLPVENRPIARGGHAAVLMVSTSLFSPFLS
jgi:hypothetical protein